MGFFFDGILRGIAFCIKLPFFVAGVCIYTVYVIFMVIPFAFILIPFFGLLFAFLSYQNSSGFANVLSDIGSFMEGCFRDTIGMYHSMFWWLLGIN